MKILIFNWRDIKNPASGGAEILTHEMAKYWVQWGNTVTMFTSRFPNCLDEETVDGIKIIRRGFADPRTLSQSVYWQAYAHYKKYFQHKFDIVIDEIHGLPFFTPLYVKEKKIAFICELGGVLWNMFGPLYAFLGRLIEKMYIYLIYRNTFYITISPSTKEDLTRHGVSENHITIIPMGITVPKKIKTYPKEKKPTIIFVARLTKAKGIEDAIHALQLIKEEIPDIRLWVIGRGNEEYVLYIKKLVADLFLDKNIKFFGFVSEQKKFALMSQAHILLVPSIKEGWGLTVAEAGVVGTPAITYDSLGLRDVLQNNTLGVVTKENTPEQLAHETLQVLHNKKLYSHYVKKIIVFRKQIGWEHTAKFAFRLLQKQLS